VQWSRPRGACVGAEVSAERRAALLAHHLAYTLPQHLSHGDGADTSTTGGGDGTTILVHVLQHRYQSRTPKPRTCLRRQVPRHQLRTEGKEMVSRTARVHRGEVLPPELARPWRGNPDASRLGSSWLSVIITSCNNDSYNKSSSDNNNNNNNNNNNDDSTSMSGTGSSSRSEQAEGSCCAVLQNECIFGN
jgi:hypothetical protein